MIFIDTSAFIARYVEHDQYHAEAVDHWRQLRQERRRCFTSNFVLDETFTLLARQTTYEFAATRAQQLLQSQALTIWRPSPEDERAAVDLFRKFADQKVSFTDSVSFVLMRQHHLSHVFTFDRHFALAGFMSEPSVVAR